MFKVLDTSTKKPKEIENILNTTYSGWLIVGVTDKLIILSESYWLVYSSNPAVTTPTPLYILAIP